MLKKTLWIFNIFLIFVFLPLYANAADRYVFETVDLSADEIEMVWNNIKLEKDHINSLSDCSSSIVSFDVSKDGYILLGLKDKTIVIADQSGNILKSFKFITNGTFYVKWEDSNFLLMLVRSSLIIELTPEGQLVNITQTDDNDVNNKLWRTVKQKEISVDDSKYIIRNKFGPLNIISGSYSQLVKIDNTKKETILYDVNTEQLTKVCIALIFTIVFFVLVFYYILKRPIKDQSRYKTDGSDQSGDGSVSCF